MAACLYSRNRNTRNPAPHYIRPDKYKKCCRKSALIAVDGRTSVTYRLGEIR